VSTISNDAKPASGLGAHVQVFITAGGDDLGEAIAELMITLNARWWDDSDATCERVLAWLKA
jgi:hypothetical protein